MDQRFDSTETFRPSTMIRTQLRLAAYYLQAADGATPAITFPDPRSAASAGLIRTALAPGAHAQRFIVDTPIFALLRSCSNV